MSSMKRILPGFITSKGVDESGYGGKVASGEDGCGCAAAVAGIAWKPHILMLSAEYREQPPGIVVAT